MSNALTAQQSTALRPAGQFDLSPQTFDQALFDLYEAHQVTYEDALRNADSVNDLRLTIKLQSQRAKTQDMSAGTEHLSIV